MRQLEASRAERGRRAAGCDASEYLEQNPDGRGSRRAPASSARTACAQTQAPQTLGGTPCARRGGLRGGGQLGAQAVSIARQRQSSVPRSRQPRAGQKSPDTRLTMRARHTIQNAGTASWRRGPQRRLADSFPPGSPQADKGAGRKAVVIILKPERRTLSLNRYRRT